MPRFFSTLSLAAVVAAAVLSSSSSSSSLFVRADPAALGVLARETGLRGPIINAPLGGGAPVGPVGVPVGGGGSSTGSTVAVQNGANPIDKKSKDKQSSLGGGAAVPVDPAAAAAGSAGSAAPVGFVADMMQRKFSKFAPRPAAAVPFAGGGGGDSSTTSTVGGGGGALSGRRLKQVTPLPAGGGTTSTTSTLLNTGANLVGGLLGGGNNNNNNDNAAGASGSSGGGGGGGLLRGPTIRLPSSSQLRFFYSLGRPLVNGYLGQQFLPALATGPVPVVANLAAPGPLGVVSG